MDERKNTLSSYGQNSFLKRHLGPTLDEQREMLALLGLSSKDELVDKTLPSSIRLKKELNLEPALTEFEALKKIKNIATKNKIWRNFIGAGYSSTITPSVIQRNILENPGWYTQYTPYQAEIAQGRMEALLNFQTMVCDLTGLDIANASLLDESTACAEAMSMCHFSQASERPSFAVSLNLHPQNLAVLKTRAEGLKIKLEFFKSVADLKAKNELSGVIIQYPDTYGDFSYQEKTINDLKSHGVFVVACCDILSLLLLKSPKELGADIAVGSTQRFGIPLGFGGPHAAFIACKDDFKRKLPGRLIGVSKDQSGKKALRLALQTREQHIRRDKATSNICTSQVLLAVMASMYACYHGPKGLKDIALTIHDQTNQLAFSLGKEGFKLKTSSTYFDTLTVLTSKKEQELIQKKAEDLKINFRYFAGGEIGISLGEKTSPEDLEDIFSCFSSKKLSSTSPKDSAIFKNMPDSCRTTSALTHPIFSAHQSESKLMRYIKALENKDLSLTTSMIPRGSCTMKLNAAAELMPITWPEFNDIHPCAPNDQWEGYQKIFSDLSHDLCELTGFSEASLQPNSGAQGEYAGLLAIKNYFSSKKENHRDICLIPVSAHGTNPASAALAGFKVITVACDKNGNINLSDLKEKALTHKNSLACLMITYPSTHGVFEEEVKEACEVIHSFGGQVYMDGANMNAQLGLCRPADIGADVCHLNLHKTFCIPHGGGGPGMGPICVAKHLAAFLPDEPFSQIEVYKNGSVSQSAFGSASILPISWMYIKMMGEEGLKEATKVAILNANYIAKKLEAFYPVLYKGKNGFVAHECIIDTRPLKQKAGVEVEDIAKRLMDYGFHAPTISFPVPGTMMIEPTESEGKEEIDRFCEAMISIRKEISEIEEGKASKENNLLKNSPHTLETVCSDAWDFPYPREQACFPIFWIKERKFWPSVARVDNAYGDRNLFCTCDSLSES